ncbi:MAG: hypothetical protein NT013_26150 [Planctomycetia bacterium]|nr:hypothetical protein [Planctomycetia bacterium]
MTVLIALVAQGIALMSPVCFVRCVGADGHECVELAGIGCHCGVCETNESLPQLCAVTTCDHFHDDEEQEVPEGWQVRCDECSCQHSVIESVPQTQNKSQVSDALQAWHEVLLALNSFDVVATDSRLDFASLSLLRPHESPQLALLATVALRV